jgi:hypothetical protein
MFIPSCRHFMPDSLRSFARRARRVRSRRDRAVARLEPLESRWLLTTFLVNNTADSGPGSLRAAIIASNNATPGPNSIDFAIPASNASKLNMPVSGFDPNTQTWTIKPLTALPAITTQVTIDGYTEANVGVPYNYPSEFTNAIQSLGVSGATGGTFTLKTSAPLPGGTTSAIPYNAAPQRIQTALEAIVGVGNVSVTSIVGQTGTAVDITFQGAYAGEAIPNLTADATNLVGTSPSVDIITVTVGGVTAGPPIEIVNTPNTTAAIDGNNARIRVIIDGSTTVGATGFVLDTSSAILRGLIIKKFDVGVSVPNASNVGNLIQGDFIGNYILYPVDPKTGLVLPSPGGEEFVDGGNALQGVIINGANTTLGGARPQDDVVIAGNGAEGVWLQSGSQGSQVLGCQIGVVGPSDYGIYTAPGNGADGVLVQSPSDLIGAAGAGNIIAASAGDGVKIEQVQGQIQVDQVQVAGNYIGVAPGGGFKFGNPAPGNAGDGVEIIGSPNDTVGGNSAAAGNTISDNGADGVSISGAAAIGNIVANNRIGTTSGGTEALGNAFDGVFIASSQNQVGPGNVISANNVGVDISGATTTGITVVDNLIGTDATGTFGLGNEFQGVLVDGATGITIQGNGAGSQVISGNHLGIQLTNSASGVLIEGTFIGTDKTGSVALPNAKEGIRIDQGARDNTIGGATATSKNLISTNHWGIVIDGGPLSGGPSANVIEGNLIGTDITGTLPLGNEVDGVMITNSSPGTAPNSSDNTIGGLAAAQGNTIAFNTHDGVNIVWGVANTIESNSIFSNGNLGIDLNATSSANDLLPAPTVTAALPDTLRATTEIDISYTGAANSIYLIQFFSTPGSAAQASVEGKTYLGSTSIRTDSSGSIIGLQNGVLAVDVPVVVTAGDWVTATATYLASIPANPSLNPGDTSEFSALPVRAINPFLVTSLADTNALGTLREAIIFSNGHPSPIPGSPNDIQFQIPGVGLQTIVLQQPLPAITVPLVIDGYSQPGSKTNGATTVQGPVIEEAQTDLAVIQVQVDGSQLGGTSAFGLDLQAQGCTIDGLSLTGFTGAAIFLEPSSATVGGAVGDVVWGNFIGVTQFNPHSYNPVKPSTNANANGVGVLIDGPNNLVGGSATGDRNIIQGNRGDGVIVYGTQGTGNAIDTNFILDNGGDGVLLLSAANHVGEASGAGLAGAGNLISGNQGNGVHILDPMARGNTVANNEIGTQVGLTDLAATLGLAARPNFLSGVLIENAPANMIGGLTSNLNGNSSNVLSSNLLDGVTIENYNGGVIPSIVSEPPANTPLTSGTRNVVEGNFIGYNTQLVTATLPNQRDGVNISSSGNVVGGNTSAAQNQIVSNRRNGVTIAGVPLDASDNPVQGGTLPNAEPVANVVAGNYIGTVGGADQFGNSFDGILLVQAGSNTLGGTTSGAGNVISNNSSGIVIAGSLSAGNLVAANLIGTSSDASAALGNGSDGIALENASGNIIGGTTSAMANVIGGNTNGIHLSGAGATGNLIEGDFIGTNKSGAAQLGNSLDGVKIDGNASNNTVGGTATGAADIIAFNGGAGVDVLSGTGNTILSDSISSNDASGIVLVGSANHAQAAPLLASATPLTTATLVSGTLTSSPSTTFLIQLFSGTSADRAGSYEGQTLVGSTTVTTDASGQASFGVNLPASIPIGTAITATATNLSTGDTSAFSAEAINAPRVEFSAVQYFVSEPASSATITVTRDTGVGSSTVVYSASPGTAVAGVDFTPVTAALVFAPGQTSATFSVPIIATSGRVGQFTVDLGLSHPTDAGLGAPSSAVLTISSLPGSLQFDTSAVSVPASGGGVTITVDRVGGAAGTVTVNYAATAINAVPGLDFTPVSGTLTFAAGVTQQSLVLPVLNSGNANDAMVSLNLSGATGGAALGSPSVETVTIVKPLTITSEQVSASRAGITAVTFTFNKPLDPTRARNPANYGTFIMTAGRGGVFGPAAIGVTRIASAIYDPSNLTVTLIPGSALKMNHLYRIVIGGGANALLNNGLISANGVLLAGSNGVAGTPFVATVGAGTRLAYSDASGNVVSLRLNRGGFMVLSQAPDGDVQQLELVGTVPNKSTLTGSVLHGRRAGRTKLPPITGSAGVRIRLNPRAFS